jgi:hypothetical protein
MKKVSVLTASFFISAIVAIPAFSADTFPTKDTYGTAGCGLGSLVFGNQPGAVQIFAATTNGTFGTQTFGITTGTSNCGKGIVSGSANPDLSRFVENNMDNLAKEIAMGQGESLNTLADLLEIPAAGRDAFNHNLQSNYNTIFPSKNVQVAGVVNNIIAVTLAN